MARLSPVDYDPFAKAPTAEAGLEPVDYDPFNAAPQKAGAPPTMSDTGQGGISVPASGPFPAISLPQSSTGVRAPTPKTAPEPVGADPGIVEESVGDAIKGMHSTKRGAFLTAYMAGMYDDKENIADHLSASQEIEAQYPSSRATRKATEELETLKDSGAGGILPALGVYAKNPRAAVSTAIQSLPSMLSSLVTVPVGAAIGSVGGPAGAVAGGIVGIGVGSASADFGNAFEDYARDKWKAQLTGTREQQKAGWLDILNDPEKYREAGNYAAAHAGMVGAFDALGGKLGGKVGSAVATRIAERGVGKAGQIAGAAAPAIVTDATIGAAGEAGGQLAGTGVAEGSPRISDPAGVAGEFAAGLTTGGAAAAVEPVIRSTNLGGGKQTPVTPEDVAGATQAAGAAGANQQPQTIPITSDMVSGSLLSIAGRDAFYSPARQYIETKGPGAASPQQWQATLNNAPGVKQEELRDNGFHDWLEGQGDKVTKKQVLDYLDENAIRLEVTERSNDAEPKPNWTTVPGQADARYEEHTLPGDRKGYYELTLHMPSQNPDQTVVGRLAAEARGDNVQRDFVGGHYPEPNVIAHARVTERTDVNGNPMAVIEEIQSDWHQHGRKEGYRDPKQPMRDIEAELAAASPRYMQEMTNVDRLVPPNSTRANGTAILSNWGRANQAYQAGQITLEQFDHISRYENLLDERRNETYTDDRPPSGPFKQSWDELAFKRMLRWAADRGYKRIAWVNGAEQSRRYPGSSQRDAGMVQFYDKRIPSIAKRWAKTLGGTYGETRSKGGPGKFVFDVLDRNGEIYDRNISHEQVAVTMARQIDGSVEPRYSGDESYAVQYIDIPQAGVDLIQRGLPLYSEMSEASKNKRPGATLDELADVRVTALGQAFGPALNELAKRFGLKVRLKLHEGKALKLPRGDGSYRRVEALGLFDPSSNIIHIALGWHPTAAEVWGTITHELGHQIQINVYERAAPEVKTAIRAAYDEFLAKTPHTQLYETLLQRRDNAAIVMGYTRAGGSPNNSPMTVGDLPPQRRQYWTGFEEWFAEQTARWATTDRKPLALVEKFFKGLATKLLNLMEAAAKKFNMPFTPADAMTKWLNSFMTDVSPFAENINIQHTVETTGDNQKQMGPQEKAVEMQPETVAVREATDEIFKGRPPKEVQETLAYADKFNKIYKWMLGIHQVAQRNPHIKPLQEYTERLAVAQLTKQQVMIRAQEVLKKWNRLGGRQADAVTALIDDVQNMVYLTPDEVKNKVSRFPTQQEMADLIKKHKVTQEGVAVFKEVATTFEEHLTRYEAVMRAEANKTTDPVARAKRQVAVTQQIAALRAKPYFPAMRFGDYTITVRNAAGKVIHFETFEYRRTRDAAEKAIQAQMAADDVIQLGKLDRQAKPLLGVPTQLLEMMAAKLDLTKAQIDALEQLKFELSPAQSFKHRFQHKRRVAGYSQDFQRAYAAYFFHGANHLMKAMHADQLRALVAQTREETKDTHDATTRHEITAFMQDHITNWLDPKSDWAAIRSVAFLWALAFSPAAAAQNLTQTLMTTYPFLAQQFGDVKAIAMMTRVGANWQTFVKKGKLENLTDIEYKALTQGIKDGIISEAMAPELAGYAEGNTLGLGFGGTELQRHITKFNEWGAKLFELAEQVNRRLVFRTAFKLAMENPGTNYVKQMPVKHKLHYDQLRTQGWTEQHATAYVAARDATITTQFQYGKEYAPRMFRGKARSIFVFKTFIQNYVVFLANYPQAAVRSILILGFLGGLMGIPGADDLKEILQALAWRMFGKDFNLEKEARKLILEFTGQDEKGRDVADIMLHGIARRGYGIPAFMDMIGGTVGVDVPMPTFDRSKAISAGTLLPVELGKLFGPPTQDIDTVISGQAQKASGAVFGAGFNVYKALVNSKLEWTDFKRWEKAVPRSLGSLAHAYRVGTEGGERTATGSMLVKYDVRDTEQLMEVLGIAGGYMPFRTSLQWDRVIAGKDAVKLWDIRREGLMKQMGNAVLGKDQREIERVKGAIQEYNRNLPEEARGKAISSDVLRQSVGTQARSRAAREAESSVRKSDIPILREVQKLYPDSRATSVRKVPESRQ